MELIKKIILIFILAKFVKNFEFDYLRSIPDNIASFERLVCKLPPASKIVKHGCLVKHIDRKHLKVNVWGNLTAPISSIRIRSRFYYKYNTYKQLGGDININICELFMMEKRSPVVDWLSDKIAKYSNLNHKCPYDGDVYCKADNVSIDEFTYPQMMPAGRYRIDTTVFEDKERILFNVSIYFSISDHRIDVS